MAPSRTFQVDQAGDRQRLPKQWLLQILLEQDGTKVACMITVAELSTPLRNAPDAK